MFSCRANDKALRNQKFDVKNIYITVTDKNDNAPVFNEDPVRIGVYENEPINTLLYTFHATDHDSGPRGLVHYSILVDQSDDTSMFELDANTGHLNLRHILDYEVVKHVSLVVQAEDRDPSVNMRLKSTVQCLIRIIDQNDNIPHFEGRTMVRIMGIIFD